MGWHVLLTLPNREPTANRHLERLGCEVYLPNFPKAKCKHLRRGGRRWRVWRRPLFPGYVFVRSRADLASLVHMAAGLRWYDPFLRLNGHVAEITDPVIAHIRAVERDQAQGQRLPFRVGDRVTVQDGPFTGLRATIYLLSDRERITLLLDFLGQATKVEVATSVIDGAAV